MTLDISKLIMKVVDLVPVLFVFGLLIGTYFPFVFLVCFPLYEEFPIWAILNLIIYHIILILVIASYLRASLTRSYVPETFEHNLNDEDSSETENSNSENMDIFHTKFSLERKRRNAGLRVCQKCDRDKPDRSHHCSKCSKCILKMDHHCPWVNQCVGWNNYKFFFLFVLYTTILCIFGASATILEAVIQWTWGAFGWRQIVIIICLITAIVFSMTLFGFLVMHLQLILTNMTTIESFEKDRDSKFENPYSLGAFNNWKQVFGNNPLLWFLPIHSSLGDGVHFPVKRSLLIVNDSYTSNDDPNTEDLPI